MRWLFSLAEDLASFGVLSEANVKCNVSGVEPDASTSKKKLLLGVKKDVKEAIERFRVNLEESDLNKTKPDWQARQPIAQADVTPTLDAKIVAARSKVKHERKIKEKAFPKSPRLKHQASAAFQAMTDKEGATKQLRSTHEGHARRLAKQASQLKQTDPAKREQLIKLSKLRGQLSKTATAPSKALTPDRARSILKNPWG